MPAGPDPVTELARDPVLVAALQLACRAPSVHNSQPWRWRVGRRTVELHTDPSRRLPATDPDGRDLVISCGAALHHLTVALSGLGRAARLHRLPDPAQPGHLATVELVPEQPATEDAGSFEAIGRRRTDRRPFRPWPVPGQLLGELVESAAIGGVRADVVTDPAVRWALVRAIRTAAEVQSSDPAYAAELAAWSGRPDAAADGVPATAAPAPGCVPGQPPLRAFAADPAADVGIDRPLVDEPEESALLLLSTPTDAPLQWLRAGEVTSALLLTAAREGLGSSPLTQPLEVADTRALLRSRIVPAGHPQILLRIGWPSPGEVPPTPRRDLADVVDPLDPRRGREDQEER